MLSLLHFIGDEDDPDLLNELNELTTEDSEAPPPPPPRVSRAAPPPPSGSNSTIDLLQERISMYQLAESNAKTKGETSRARRFGRGLKTLNDLLKQAKAGKSINESDIPPVVATGKVSQPSAPEPVSTVEPPPEPAEIAEPVSPSLPPPSVPAPSLPTPPLDEGLQLILKRKEDLKAAALSCKHSGDKPLALEYLKVVKQFDIVVEAYKSGQEMDLFELPTVEMVAEAFKDQRKAEGETQQSSAPDPLPSEQPAGLISAPSVGEALQQHMAFYKEQESKAKEDGNSSKQRRMGRIVKQFEQAIKLNAAGRAISIENLPTPLGYAPIPLNASSPAVPPRPRAAPAVPDMDKPQPSSSAPRVPPSRADKQLALLIKRQKEFKDAALDAKRNGDLNQAKEYLRSAKGFDTVIAAAKGGLLVDLKSLPAPPQVKKKLEETFDVITEADCDPSNESVSNIYSTLQQQLSNQLKICQTNRDHYKAMGNVAEANRFENLAVAVKQDLDLVTINKRLNKPPPFGFHYESRQFSIVQCNSDLNENDLELTIVRGIAYNVPNPKEVDTYVKFEFPYPQDAPVSDRTGLVKDTNSPVYNTTFPLVIQRNARPCLRVFKRHGIKLEVYSRGGWFSKDTLLGSIVVKLAPLETVTTIHEAFPLMDGRRPAGGSLEVKLRVRTPLLQQQFENTTHRWLVIND